MWERLIGWLRFLWDSGKETQENTAAIQELDKNLDVLIELVRSALSQQELFRMDNESLRQEIRHLREKHADELEKLELKLRLQIAEELRRLPPAEDK